ncbi:MAG: hypothetical protein ACYCTV_00120 [Leptospirales bacterium]
MKKLLGTILPLLASALLLSLLGLSIHAYRNSFASGKYANPAEPRPQTPVRIQITNKQLHTFSDNPTTVFLLEVVKEKNAVFSTHYWPIGETVLSIPVLTGPNGIRVRLSLWDAGTYQIRLRDSLGTKTVLSFPIVVQTPLRLYRNDLFLAALIGFLAWGSGWVAKGIAPDEIRLFSGSARILFPTLLSAGLLLIIFSSWSLEQSARGKSLQKTAFAVPYATEETEGRTRIHPVLLFSGSHQFNNRSGLLFIRHQLDSWTDYGRVATLFEGRVPRELHSRAFLLLPDDGRYNVSLWSSGQKQNQTGTLSRTRWVLRAFPSSPPFPKALFAGLTFFSIAFFMKGVSYNPRSKEPLSKTWGEVS